MKRFLLPLLLAAAFPAAAMTGGPTFCVGYGTTSMTLEASKVNYQIESFRTADGHESVASDRVGLTARYGTTPNIDISATVGAANLSFADLPSGYAISDPQWKFAWGGSIRAGVPAKAKRYQIVASVNYAGFQPETKTTKGLKTIESKYLWHEVTPTLTLGVRMGPIVPFVGVCKPYLFGTRDVKVTMSGQPYSAGTVSEDYSDQDQAIRPMAGFEWKLPDGYSIGVEADGSMDGFWTVSVAIAQVLR